MQKRSHVNGSPVCYTKMCQYLSYSSMMHMALHQCVLLWPPYVIGQAIIFLPCDFFLSSFFSSPNLSGRRLDVYHTLKHGVALVQIYNAGLKGAARSSLQMRDPKVAKNRHLGTIAQLCRAISSQLRHVLTIGKNLLSSNISSTCPHSMVNYGPLAAEIVSLVWGTPGNFNGFRVLVALLHGTLVVGVSQTAALNRGRHLYSAGRPRSALAHISGC